MADYHKLKEPYTFQEQDKNDPMKLEELKTLDAGLSYAEVKRRMERDG
jgi:hypothetical protein